MSLTRSMSYPVPYVTSMPPYMDSQFIHPVQAPMMGDMPPQDVARSSSPQSNVPPSPTSSLGDGRISKARKGKRVHTCEFAGCGKIFTRAEHRRRHELSHRAKKTYVCTHEGCEKAFHRSDYLTQHMARHEPNSPRKKSPSVRSNSISSPAPLSQSFSSKSPVLPGFQSPVASPGTGTAAGGEHAMMSCAGCINCHQQSQNGPGGHPFYQYSNAMNPSAVSGMPMLSPQSTPPPGFDSAVDQYLRSVLRPEAFLPSHQSQETINGSFWTSHIDPNLPQVNPSAYQHPTSYPWTTGAEDLASSIPAIHHIMDTPRRPSHDS